MNKLFLKNFIDEKKINTLSRNAAIKILNLFPTFYNKNIIEIIDEKINEIENKELLDIINIRINDIKSEMNKTKYISAYSKENYKIYVYENYKDVYLIPSLININELLIKILNDEILNQWEIIYISSRTIKNPHILEKKNNEIIIKNMESIFNRIKKLDSLKIRFYNKKELSPLIIKNKKSNIKYNK